ncbi:metalloprotease [Pseudomonas sp. BCA14]|uniref:M10 family metallopeptidase C-terminal domain-containing protein n=1 Tax=unclassified Pseudomonas TaxID=196821 RepID=UPI00106EC5BB|nr:MULTISPECIES: M10 family metallopeptidase C-terminal domain-containing protein [unclassified Pseudomonas]TFF03926.1 metalloprotease [Pseudomonas sp. JMN1]TFF08826.1 metalloprotease [Pseudomonas sp. BCA17]TFF24637.1 metalloprotease [Pseudomonas sp. BCA14]TFF29546.1 metalloprotease [Pseudomonas sp. BCA13]
MQIPVRHPFLSHPDSSSYEPPPAAENKALKWAGTKRAFTTDQAAKHITRDGCRFYDRNGDNKVVVGFNLVGGFTEPQKVRIREALQYWADVTNINFVENGSNTDGHITVNGVPGSWSGHAYMPDRSQSQVTANIGTGGAERKPAIGSAFLGLAIHELGHTLGLSHPGDYDGLGHSYNNSAVYAQDTKARSVMSYWEETNQPGHNFANQTPGTPMMDDIAAVQRLYGKNSKTRNTDTTYGFNSNAGREVYSLKQATEKPVFTVWDGAGNDTLDFSGFAHNQNINLAAETFSDVGGLRGNVSIAKGVIIENAVGGYGDDTLMGNDGDNRLKGGRGSDKLRGGAGSDTFVYDRVSDSTPGKPDTLEDFTSGVDRIDVSGVLRATGLKALNFSERLSGQAGDAVLSHDSSTNRYRLAVDTTGSGEADLLILSHGQIKQTDVIWNAAAPTVAPDTEPSPEPEPTNEPTPEADPIPDLVADPTPRTSGLAGLFKRTVNKLSTVVTGWVDRVLSWFK